MLPGIITGLLSGYIASRIQKGKGSGCIVNLFLGLAGGAVGSFIFEQFGIMSYTTLGEIITAVVGAMILLWLFAKLKG